MRVQISLDTAVLTRFLRAYLVEIQRAHFPSSIPTADELANATAAKVASWWDQCRVNLADEESQWKTCELASDREFLVDLFVHSFHDAANVFRRELHARDENAVPAAVFDINWDFDVQREWCRNALDAGVVRELKFYDA